MPQFLLIGLLVVLFFLGPFLTIAALNTVFGLAIPYTKWTWLAFVWLHTVLRANKS